MGLDRGARKQIGAATNIRVKRTEIKLSFDVYTRQTQLTVNYFIFRGFCACRALMVSWQSLIAAT